MDDRVELLQRRLARERVARKQAEQIIEEKSREIYRKNEDLERAAAAERQARGEAETMLRALEAFTDRLDHREIVTHLEEFMKSLVPHDWSALYLFDGDDLRLDSVSGHTEEGRVLGEVVTPGVHLWDITQASGPVIISETIADKIPIHSEWCVHAEAESWMAVPISAHGQKIGCLVVESRQRDAFDASSRRLGQALANEAAIALENALLFQEVQELSIVDPLTGLHNRRHLSTCAKVECDRAVRHDLPLSVIMMDIDHFKLVNDTYGHAAGDRVLVEIAAVCLRELRSMDLHARYGGEEFCFFLPETALEGAVNLAERLRADVAGLHLHSDKGDFAATASFGVAERLAGEDSMDALLKRSDQALYEAKRTGRNRVVAWTFACGDKS